MSDRTALAEALRGNRRARRGSLLAYLMTDARRARAWESIAETLKGAGVTGVELGIPFSDPIADGPVLQRAAERSLGHHTSWNDVVTAAGQVSKVLPTAVMTYANLLWQRGLARSLGELRGAGVDAVIVPDLPLDESASWRRAARRAKLGLVLLASPATSPDRARRIAQATDPFLYVVGQYGTTGKSAMPVSDGVFRVIDAAHQASPDLPVLVGFGVQNSAHARRWRSGGADGVVVGSGIEERLRAGTTLGRAARWIRSIALGVGVK